MNIEFDYKIKLQKLINTICECNALDMGRHIEIRLDLWESLQDEVNSCMDMLAELRMQHISDVGQEQDNEPVAYADPQAFINFKNTSCTKEWMWQQSDSGLVPVYIRQPAQSNTDNPTTKESLAVADWNAQCICGHKWLATMPTENCPQCKPKIEQVSSYDKPAWYEHTAELDKPLDDDLYVVDYLVWGLKGSKNMTQAMIHFNPLYGWRSKVTPCFIGNTPKDSLYAVHNMVSFRKVFAQPSPNKANVPTSATHYAVGIGTNIKFYYKQIDEIWFWTTSFQWKKSVANKEWINEQLIILQPLKDE